MMMRNTNFVPDWTQALRLQRNSWSEERIQGVANS